MMQKIGWIFLWISVIAWALWFGALMYEMNVVTPLWSGNLPQSAVEWNSRPNFMLIPTPYYVPVALTTILSSLLAAILGWKTENRILLALSFICAIGTLAFTLTYFFPRNEVLFLNKNTGLSGEEITAIAKSWINANYIRVAIMAIGFFAALKAFRSGNNGARTLLSA